MSEGGGLLIVIPAYNEAGRIGDVVRRVRARTAEVPGITTVVVVDDGSSDGTAGEARAAGAEVLSHPFNLGYGAALQTGYHFALRRGCARLVQLDADGQHDPDSIPALLAGLDDGLDVAIGSRYLTPQPPCVGRLRRLGSRLFGRIATLWTGVRITDPTSGFQALKQAALKRLVRDSFPEDYPDTDVIISLSRAGLRLGEVAVRMHPRRGGRSMHRGGKVAFYAYKMLLNLTLLPVRRESPFRSGRIAG